MKKIIPIAFMGISNICLGSIGANLNEVVIYATEQSRGSISIGSESAYTKIFLVTIANLSGKDIDLSALCLLAYAPDGDKFDLDTIDKELITGRLESKAIIKGVAAFASQNEKVFSATLVKESQNCN
jgi:hypothetical protein